MTLAALKEEEQAAALHVQRWARQFQVGRYLRAGGSAAAAMGSMDSMQSREAQSYSHTQATLPYSTIKFKRPDQDQAQENKNKGPPTQLTHEQEAADAALQQLVAEEA